MGSFHQPDFIAPSDWDYGMAQTYAPGYVDDAMARQTGLAMGFGSTNDMSTASNVMYVGQGYGPQSSAAAAFHVPSGSASARRHASSQRSSTSMERDEDKPSRRIKRTRTACEECRKRKQKCDGGEPCQSCEEQHTDCKYRDVPPTKKDDTMEKMVKLAETYNSTLASLCGDIDIMSATLRSIEARLNQPWPMPAGVGGAGVLQHQLPLHQQLPQHSVESWQQLNADHSPSSSSASLGRDSQ
ncbi:hypothetical protein CERZMDRAFT_103148 [Cercospora zeae-maydis SCOH1-5]|uniref:Zn(2)-C6 fungal-type domain-containing protein n=1 Tax=Cercospora zeae-maydis SCOH1-5 TaxID=717836 RepID=A0A6A6F049_9PEZI|nr:hypothetical protein CERZMDRAFT_103148 [Cercospora zeae-maydis SCOH1-5]